MQAPIVNMSNSNDLLKNSAKIELTNRRNGYIECVTKNKKCEETKERTKSVRPGSLGCKLCWMHLVPRLIDFTEIIVNCSIWLYLLTKNDSQDTCFTPLLLQYSELKRKTVWNPHFFPSWLKTWLIKASTHRPGTRRRLFLSTTPNALLIFVQHNCLRKTRFLKIFFFFLSVRHVSFH